MAVLCLFFSAGTLAAGYRVANLTQYNEAVKKMVPGDTIMLANGVWKDAGLVFRGKGKPGMYLYLTAEDPGEVSLEGSSSLRLSGEWLHISGLMFRNGCAPGKAVIEFRTGSKDYAFHSVLTGCVIDGYSKTPKDSADHWIGIYGKFNTVEYCYFAGKSNEGTTLVVWPDNENSDHNKHHIYRNYFGPRPRLGSNGGETIRIGTSQVCMNSSETIVEGNFFEHCNGETEIISNKSCDNLFLNNTFFESEGSLVLRHGDRAVVAGNWFIGNGKIFTGGVRVINEGHLIYNNFFYRLRGDEFRSPLAIMNSIPDTPLNGYAQVKNVVVANNTYYDCSTPWAFGVGFGDRNRIVRAENTLLLNNMVYSPGEKELIRYYDQAEGVILENNLLFGTGGLMTGKGMIQGDIETFSSEGFETVLTSAKAKKLPYVQSDILGRPRQEAVVGAFQSASGKPAVERASAENCGPVWYKKKIFSERSPHKPVGKTIPVAPGTGLLAEAARIAGSGDILLLGEGEHWVTGKILVSKDLFIRAAEDAKKQPVIVLRPAKEHVALFELTGNANLSVAGVKITGNGSPAFPGKYAFIARENAFGYSLHLDHCEIDGFVEPTGSVFKAYKGSFADSIVVRNSVIRNSIRGFSLSDEKEDTGKYNAENILFVNTLFSEIQNHALYYYRGGNDESTLGGSLWVDHCVFDRIGADAKQYILRVPGIVRIVIRNSVFYQSEAHTTVRLEKPKNLITHCSFYRCAVPETINGASAQSILGINPKFRKGSFQLSSRSGLKGKATDGGDIGLK